jgi:hypothetical protein
MKVSAPITFYQRKILDFPDWAENDVHPIQLFSQRKGLWRAFMNTIMDFRIPLKQKISPPTKKQPSSAKRDPTHLSELIS